MIEIYFKCTKCGDKLLSEEVTEHEETHIQDMMLQSMVTDKKMRYGRAVPE